MEATSFHAPGSGADGRLYAVPPGEYRTGDDRGSGRRFEVGAPFAYLAWPKAFGVACAGNVIGGVGFVTDLRMVQVGRAKIEQEREAADP